MNDAPETTQDPRPQSAMQPRRTWFAAIAAAPLIAGLTLTSLGAGAAGPGKGGPGFEGRGFGARMCAHLECTDTQKEQLRAVMKEMREDIKPDREAIRDLRKKMGEEFAKEKPSEKQLRSLQAQIAKHHGEIADRRLDAMLEVHGLLDAEQRKKLAEKMAKGKRGKHGKHHRRGGKGKRDKIENK